VEDDFQAKIDGTDANWGQAYVLDAGAHTASETWLAGYSAGSWGGDCNSNGSITLALDEDAVCTITNSQNAPPPPPPEEVPVDNIWALLLLILAVFGMAWYWRPAVIRR
jgi:hypothetical protein